MKEVIRKCGKEEVIEMMPSFCYYYNEALYCQSFLVRSEVNNGTPFVCV